MAEQQVILEARNITKDYGGGRVLDGVSLQVHKGEVIVLIGPSGCGKSTFLRCMNGLEQIQSGQILLDGEVITEGKTDWTKVRQKIGMVFQSYELFPHMSVIDNLVLGPVKVQGRDKKEVTKEAEKLLERVGLLDKKDAFPRQLSGGQKQRVAIVRALILKPEILLFDEVTAALDPEMVREVLDVILELAADGYTMLIVTHEMQFAKAVADKIVFIDGGKVVESGIPEKFFTQPETDRARRFLNTFIYAKGGEKA
ncbi:MAG: amino acid ABC transporter ATP-binding protein [Lachnospiraceae bacterium]|nr:amino acid ABC transporter ATP-binding protein [Lachnospiraceae bacterium]